MTCRAVFAGNAKLTIRWSGTTMPKLEADFEALLAMYGLYLVGCGHDVGARERVMRFVAINEEEHYGKEWDENEEG